MTMSDADREALEFVRELLEANPLWSCAQDPDVIEHNRKCQAALAVLDHLQRVAQEHEDLLEATILGPLAGRAAHDEIVELRDRVRIAEAVRDDARRASALDLEMRREAMALAAQATEVAQRAAGELARLKAKVGVYLTTMQAIGSTTDGPTIGGEDLMGLDPVERRALIRSVVMGEDPAPAVKATLAIGCKLCRDTGVIETGNNDLPCDCRCGDRALFNSEGRTMTGAEIKARYR